MKSFTILIRLMGSLDSKQIDELGGFRSVTSKVVIAGMRMQRGWSFWKRCGDLQR